MTIIRRPKYQTSGLKASLLRTLTLSGLALVASTALSQPVMADACNPVGETSCPTSECFFWVSGVLPGHTKKDLWVERVGSVDLHTNFYYCDPMYDPYGCAGPPPPASLAVSTLVGPGNYPDSYAGGAGPFATAHDTTFDAIAIGSGTHVKIWSGPNYTGSVLLDVTGPYVLSNEAFYATYGSSDYDDAHAQFMADWSSYGGVLTQFTPSTRHILASQDMHTWGTGSVQVTCAAPPTGPCLPPPPSCPPDGSCNSFGSTYSTQPADAGNGCASGSYSDAGDSPTHFIWNCNSTTCYAAKTSAPPPGACVSYPATYATQPATDTASGCTTGAYSDTGDYGSLYQWYCDGTLCQAAMEPSPPTTYTYGWVTGDWSDWDNHCSTTARRTRAVWCFRYPDNFNMDLVDPSQSNCYATAGPKPDWEEYGTVTDACPPPLPPTVQCPPFWAFSTNYQNTALYGPLNENMEIYNQYSLVDAGGGNWQLWVNQSQGKNFNASQMTDTTARLAATFTYSGTSSFTYDSPFYVHEAWIPEADRLVINTVQFPYDPSSMVCYQLPHGYCGSANGQTYSYSTILPAGDLCAQGYPTRVKFNTATLQYSWACLGIGTGAGGGSDSLCTATATPPPICSVDVANYCLQSVTTTGAEGCPQAGCSTVLYRVSPVADHSVIEYFQSTGGTVCTGDCNGKTINAAPAANLWELATCNPPPLCTN